MPFPVVVQHRHVHLSLEDAQALFGNQPLTSQTPLDQRGQFVAQQTVGVHGPSGFFQEVCVLGPHRAQTQVELSASDAFSIGVQAPIRVSADLDRCATVLLKTSFGELTAKTSTIIPVRHLHLPPSIAQELGLSHHEIVTLERVGLSKICFDQVIVRVHPTFHPAFHLTKDEAAPHWIQTGEKFVLSQ